MFGACCACQDPEEKKQQIVYDPVLESQGAEFPDDPNAKSYPTYNPQESSGAGASPPSSQRSVSSLSPEEKAREKARLQELVKSFAKRAVQGITCTLVTDSGALRPAKYHIDKRLQKLMIKVEDQDPPDFSRTCPLAQITEIYRPEDGEHFFPKTVQDLNDDQKKRLLMISYTGERSASERFLFLENDTFDRERFLTCMKILRFYSQTNTPKDQ